MKKLLLCPCRGHSDSSRIHQASFWNKYHMLFLTVKLLRKLTSLSVSLRIKTRLLRMVGIVSVQLRLAENDWKILCIGLTETALV